jgi:precorrin-3B C17-methyltransferase
VSRPDDLERAFEILTQAGCGARIVIFAQAVTTADERIISLPLSEATPDMADMRTLVIVGNSQTRRVGRWIYAPRRAS